jgi:hypothetical protein
MRVMRFVMTRQQRFKYEMFVRVRDFGTAHAALFPEASKGGQAFARVLSAVAAIDEHAKNHVLGRAEARRIKDATRDAVFEYLKTIAAAARRVTRAESSVNPFALPKRRSLAAELATARAFMEAAATRQAEFEQFGLPPTFISDFRALVEHLQQAADVRLSSKTVRRKAQAGIATALAQGWTRLVTSTSSSRSRRARRIPRRLRRGPARGGSRAWHPAPRRSRWRRWFRRPSSRRCRRCRRSASWTTRRETPATGRGARLPQRHHRPMGGPRRHHHRARLSHASRRRARRHPPGEAAPRGPGDSRAQRPHPLEGQLRQ